MSDRHPHVTRLSGATALAILTLTLAAPAPAHAQFGGLLKKAKKAVSASAPGAAHYGPAPQFDSVVLELDADRLDHVIAGLTAEQQLRTDASWRQRYTAELRARETVQQRVTANFDAHEKESAAYDRATLRNRNCRDSVSYALTQQHEHEDEAAYEKNEGTTNATVAQFRQQMMDAAARGDAAAMKKIQQKMMAAMQASQQTPAGIAARRAAADSAAITQACGAPPAKPPFLVARDSLRERATHLNDTIRATEEELTDAGPKSSGLTDTQFAMALERIRSYLHGSGGYSHAELDALAAKRDELQELLDDHDKPLPSL